MPGNLGWARRVKPQPGHWRSDMYAQGFTADRRGMIVDLTFQNASVQSAVEIDHFTALALWKRLGELLGAAGDHELEALTFIAR